MRARESPSILLVDDHAVVRHGLALVLTEEGVGECREAAGREEALAGRRFISPHAALALADDVPEPAADDAVRKLSANERKIYELLGKGADTFDIAAALHISNRTVDSYYGRMLVK